MEKNDLVYILGTGSRWRNNEIRYSIRSAETNFPGRRIVIIGECPEFLTGLTHIPIPDKHKNKQENAREKYLAACEDARVSDDFILMNDDFFFLSPVKIKPYILGTLEDMIRKHPTKGGYYYQSMIDTKKLLESKGIKNPLSFEVHAPMIFNKKKLKETIQRIGTDKAYAFRSVYGNLHPSGKPEKVVDFKANNLAEFAYQRKTNRELLSTSDNLIVHKEFRDWLRAKFRRPSKYENDRGDGIESLPGAPIGSMRYYAKDTFEYASRSYSAGEIIDEEDMEEIRYNKNLSHVWEQK